MKHRLQKIQQDIRDLRDADQHVCPEAMRETWGADVDGECSCASYDSVIDALQIIIDNIDSDELTPEECVYWRNREHLRDTA
jgi:hypothetical protein